LSTDKWRGNHSERMLAVPPECGRLDSQRQRSRTEVKINFNAAVRPETLRAGDGSRSVPASQIVPLVVVSRCVREDSPGSLLLFPFSKSPRLPEKLEHFGLLFEEMGQIRKDFHSVRAKMMLDAFDVLALGFGIEIEQ
jgi:hypothetical protein